MFSKGRLLYGLNWAKQAARRDERMLVVEGYFDVAAPDRRGHRERRRADGHRAHRGPGEAHPPLHRARLPALRFGQGGAQGHLPLGRRAAAPGRGRAGGDAAGRRGSRTRSCARTARAALEAQLAASIDVFERKIQLLERGGWFADLRKKRQALDRLLPTLRATSDPLTRDMYLGHARTRRASRASCSSASSARRRAARRGGRPRWLAPRTPRSAGRATRQPRAAARRVTRAARRAASRGGRARRAAPSASSCACCCTGRRTSSR